MTDKYMNRFSAGLVRKWIQVKIIMEYLYIFKERIKLNGKY
jgi:hypothetical protein